MSLVPLAICCTPLIVMVRLLDDYLQLLGYALIRHTVDICIQTPMTSLEEMHPLAEALDKCKPTLDVPVDAS